MAPRVEKYDPNKKEHGSGCNRLCCNNDRFYDPRDKIPESPKNNYFTKTLYTIGILTILSILGYCSQPEKDAPRAHTANLSHKLEIG